MLFRPTEKSTPSATATIGEPSGAKMSTPWCHPTVARAAPHVSLNDVGRSTGKTYGPPESSGVPLYGMLPLPVPLSKMPPRESGGLAVVGAGGVGAEPVVVVGRDRFVGAGGGGVAVVTVGGDVGG